MNIIEKIKLLLRIRKPAEELAGELKGIKAGYKTLPFWVSVLATLGTLAATLTGYIPVTTALIISTVVGCLYNILRAIQNAQVEGVQHPLQSTRFWVGLLTIVTASIESLKSGGINPAWLATATTIIAAVMAAAQSVGAKQPEKP
jgi:hypothetical protein